VFGLLLVLLRRGKGRIVIPGRGCGEGSSWARDAGGFCARCCTLLDGSLHRLGYSTLVLHHQLGKLTMFARLCGTREGTQCAGFLHARHFPVPLSITKPYHRPPPLVPPSDHLLLRHLVQHPLRLSSHAPQTRTSKYARSVSVVNAMGPHRD
jgi:hypothetical protein